MLVSRSGYCARYLVGLWLVWKADLRFGGVSHRLLRGRERRPKKLQLCLQLCFAYRWRHSFFDAFYRNCCLTCINLQALLPHGELLSQLCGTCLCLVSGAR